jgi:hypothetical protein
MVKIGKPANIPWYVEAFNCTTNTWIIQYHRTKRDAIKSWNNLAAQPRFQSVAYGWDVKRTGK